ncbi:MAG: metalloprotease TldD [Zetaproteobacteria bacterium]|nr:metalloprotease TldD [Zetaproteobacteria bacterium]
MIELMIDSKTPFIDESLLTQTLNQMLCIEADDADLYAESGFSESLSMEEGRVKHVSASSHCGIGARVVIGEMSGHACTDRFDPASLKQMAQAAKSVAKAGKALPTIHLSRPNRSQPLYSQIDPTLSVNMATRKALLERIDQLTRAIDPRVKQVFANVSASFEDIYIVRMDGNVLHDARPLVRFNISVVVEQNGRRENGSAGGGGRYSLDELLNGSLPEYFAREAVRMALLNLEAIATPAGIMPVVLGPGWPGILLHEAIGHGLEGDFNRKGTSVFSGRIGERIAAKGVTVIDDGTIPNRRGSLNIDDEGTPTQRTTLIEDGILTGYLMDRQNARLMGMPSTGNGRRESYADPILPRMTNTFMLAGEHSPEEAIRSLKHGIYAVNFGGGQVDITSGKFVFTTSEAYLVEDGQIKTPVKGATLMGNGPDVLKKVSMIGNDLKLDPGVGTCGKDGQSVPVGVGLPTLRIDELTIGGTQL